MAPTMEQENALVSALDKMEPDEWLALVRYIALQLVNHGQQSLLAEILCREAQRRAEARPASVKPSDCLAQVLEDCGLKIVITS